MARNEVSRLKITIDIDQATGKILRFNQTIGKTKHEVQQTGQAMTNMAAQTNAAGQSATTAAVNFQTMSQGLLNLSTSVVQTATSFSNLDRARNRAAASEVAYARAEDLLMNKKTRLAEIEARGLGQTQKAINLRNELATATQDLAVKEEKMKIEQSAVTDVYMLFFANIANVGFSTMQTLVALLGQEKAARIASMVATKAHTVALHGNNLAYKLGIISVNGYTVSQQLGIATTRALTVSTKGLTFAIRGMNITLGPLGIAMAAISGLLLTWDMHLGKVFGSLGDLTGGIMGVTSAEEEMIDETYKLTGAVEELDKSVGFKLPDSLGTAMVSLDRYSSKLRDMQKEAVITAAVNQAVADSMDNVAQKKTTISDSVGFSLLPKAFAETTGKPIDEQAYREWLSASGFHGVGGGEFVGGTTMLPLNATQLSARHGISEEAYNALPDEAKEFLETRDIIIPYLSTFVGDKSFRQAEITQRGFDAQTKFYTPQTWKEEKLKLEGDRIEREERSQLPRERLQLSEISNRIYNTYYGRFGTGGFSSKEYANLVRQEAAKAGINMSKYKNTIMNGINLFTGEQVTSLREQAGYEITDKPEAIRNKMIGTISGIYDKDDPRMKLLLSGKSDITEERLAILAKYGIDVGMGGGETEAILATYANTVSDSRRNLMRGRLEGSDLSAFGLQSGLSSLGQTSVEQTKSLNKMVSTMNEGYARQLELYSAKGNVQLYKELGGGNIIEGMQQYVALGGSDFFKYNAGTSDFAVGKGFEGVSATAAAQRTTGSQRRAMAAAQQLGRMTWYKEQNKNYTMSRGGSGKGIVNHYVKNATTEEDRQAMDSLAASHDSQVRQYAQEAFDLGRDIDILWLRKQTENQARALSASISARIAAEEAKATQFREAGLSSLSQQEALSILRDKAQGEQTLIDMLAYQQRLDAMSNGVVS